MQKKNFPFFYKFVFGLSAFALAFVMGCGDSDSASASSESNEEISSDSDSTEVSSSSEAEDENMSSQEEDESSSSEEETDDMSSSSKKESKSSSSSKKASSSSSKKELSIELDELPSSCPVAKHSKKVKTLTKNSENTIAALSLEFDNEFASKGASEATFYEDGSFLLKCGDEKGCMARTRFVNTKSVGLDELGDISVDLTFTTGGEADSSYVGASAYASNESELVRVYVYFVNGFVSNSSPLIYGEEFTNVNVGFENYTLYKSLSQKQTSKGTEKTYTYYVLQESLEQCSSIDVSGILLHIPEIAEDDNVVLRWLGVSAEIRGDAKAAVDMLEAKVNIENAYELDESDASNEFCKETIEHTGKGTALNEDGSVELTVDSVSYIYETSAMDGFKSKYYKDGSFEMECPDAAETNCESNLFRDFGKKKYTSFGRIDVEYSFEKEGASGQSFIGVHGYMDDDGREIEFFVLEDWLESFPITKDYFGEKKGEITVDGSVYEVYYLAEEATAENQLPKDQYRITSIRKDKRRCGSVNMSAQLEKWTKELGIEVFPLVKMGVSGFFVAGANGSVDFTYAKVNVQE